MEGELGVDCGEGELEVIGCGEGEVEVIGCGEGEVEGVDCGREMWTCLTVGCER